MFTLVICDEGTTSLIARDYAPAVIEKFGDEDGFKMIRNMVLTPLFDEYLERHRTWQEAARRIMTTGRVNHVCFVKEDFDRFNPALIPIGDFNMSLEDPLTDWEIRNRGASLGKRVGVV